MNEPQQSHEWQFWTGVIALIVAIPFAVATDVLPARLAFSVVALAGFIMAARAVALDAGKTFDNRSYTDRLLSQPPAVSSEELAPAVAQKRRQLRSGRQSLRERAPFLLIIILLTGLSWFTAGVFTVVLIWELLRIRRELNARDQLEMTTATTNSTSGTST